MSNKNYNNTLLLVNFGGPRQLQEVAPFLKELLCDQDVVQTNWPRWWHRFFFSCIAKKRSKAAMEDYRLIGGGSTIYEDTEKLALQLQEILNQRVVTFHRYLSSTHQATYQKLLKDSSCAITVFPLFPQFTYATTGSIARLLVKNLPKIIYEKMEWIRSWPSAPTFIDAWKKTIDTTMQDLQLNPNDCVLLFSAHGVPQKFTQQGDPYEKECYETVEALKRYYPKCEIKLCFQSQFGRSEWIRPYTSQVCKQAEQWRGKTVLVIPISFTSEHIETLFEIETLYLPVIREKGVPAFRVPTPYRNIDWPQALAKIIEDRPLICTSHELVRPY